MELKNYWEKNNQHMKKLMISLSILVALSASAQQFKKSVTTAKSSYASGKLEDAHFALQQSLQELDIVIGKEVLKQLPQRMDTLKVNSMDDNVMGNVSFVGATIRRTYGLGSKKAEIEIVNNSPMLGTLNALMSSPLFGMGGGDGKTKMVKVQGYKGRLTREEDSQGMKPGYKLELPFSNALVSFKVSNTSDDEVLAWANTIPLDKIAKLIQ
jgi:hypothetical protein